MTETLQKMMDEEVDRGRAEGRNSVNNLITILVNAGRTDDLVRSATDADYQQQLMDELLGDNN